MNQEQRRDYLIRYLIEESRLERREYADLQVPADLQIPKNESGQKRLLRSLLNIRMPLPASDRFFEIQDAYLKEEIRKKKITKLSDLTPVQNGLYLWQGDITTLSLDAIVNAANSQLLGCFCPCHGCIDNAIHTFSGIQLRSACAKLMEEQGREESVGKAKITKGYNLPCRYVIHTVGPRIQGRLTDKDCKRLSSCYRSCLSLAEENKIKSIAFCCISTGEFHFPNDLAADIAIRTVKEYREQTHSEMEVVFNVFTNEDYQIYQKRLGAD